MEIPQVGEAVNLEKVLPTLLKSGSFHSVLRKQFDISAADQMVLMMQDGAFSGSAGDDLENFLVDAVVNDSEIAWSGLIKGSEDNYPVGIRSYHGVYYVSSLEEDDVGYFLDFESAKCYVEWNWNDLLMVEAIQSLKPHS
jgi:hypothetical protein